MSKRSIGHEILDGLRELKRGEYGRVANVPDASKDREKTGLHQSRSWAAEIKRRVVQLETGSVETVPWSQVKDRLFRGYE